MSLAVARRQQLRVFNIAGFLIALLKIDFGGLGKIFC